MAVTSRQGGGLSGSRSGYGWSLPGVTSGQSAVREGANVRVYSAKGLSAPGVLGTSPLPQIGTPIPGTVFVYVRPRLSQDEGIGGGGGGSQIPFWPFKFPGGGGIPGMAGVNPSQALANSVHVTNPLYANFQRYRRTASIGMGGALQTGLNMGVPYESPGLPFFSIA